MVTARETVQEAFLAAGRPDAYNEDLIYYVTDEQFGYVAYLSGMMVREKPAACIYMGCFYAESLILAETGNSIGAIQAAGTAMPAQLPFFVAACDYTLIGEEFYAASAYLSESPAELGSLKGQDLAKVLAFGLIGSVHCSPPPPSLCLPCRGPSTSSPEPCSAKENPTMMKRTIPMLLAMAAGIVMILAYFFLPLTPLQDKTTVWFNILAAVAFILGGATCSKFT